MRAVRRGKAAVRLARARAVVTCMVVASTLVACAEGGGEASPTTPGEGRLQHEFTPVSYGAEEGLELDLYLPGDATAGAPLVIVVHGGGWTQGAKEDFTWLATKLNDAGLAVANVDYRLLDVKGAGDQVTFASQLEDIAAAIDAAKDEAGLAGSGAPVALVGASAGGHLALMYAALHPEQVASVVALAPISDVTQPETMPAHGLAEAIDVGSGVGDGDPIAARAAASPVLLATAEFPPTLLVHGDADEVVPWRQSSDMAARLDGLGVDAQLLTLLGGGHFDDWDYDEVVDATATWIVAHP